MVRAKTIWKNTNNGFIGKGGVLEYNNEEEIKKEIERLNDKYPHIEHSYIIEED